MCIPLINLKVYSKYYNFTIQDAIKHKKKKLEKINKNVIVNTDNSWGASTMNSESQASYRYNSGFAKFSEP